MKRLAWVLFTVLLTGCGTPAVGPPVTPTVTPAVMSVRTEGPLSDRIAEVASLTVEDVQAIWRFDDSRPPDTPSRIVYREKDLKELLQALQAVRLTQLLGPTQTVAPGDYYSYRVYLFSGKTINIHFTSSRVISQEKYRGYENSAPVQQAIDGLERDPYLLDNDAYETVEQVNITSAAGEHTVTDRKQIEDYVRMFHWMKITGRSREPLTDGSTYIFRQNNGKETMLKYKGTLLATAEGTYQVTPDPAYMVPEAADN